MPWHHIPGGDIADTWETACAHPATWYDVARARVDSASNLAPFADILVEDDWGWSYEHYEWVATEKERNLLAWCTAIRDAQSE